jgi:hypothetical protein
MTADLAILVLGCATWLNRAQDNRLRFLLVQVGVWPTSAARPTGKAGSDAYSQCAFRLQRDGYL